MNGYKQKMREWVDEKKRQTVEFTITENDLDADRRIPNRVEVVRWNSASIMHTSCQ